MKVSVGHLTFSVAHATPEWCATHQGYSGMCMMNRGEIVVRPGLGVPEEAATLLHELLHAIWHAYVLPDDISEEDACRRLEGPLLALMSDNPQVVAALIAARGGIPLPLN